jgi:hypothetical protein
MANELRRMGATLLEVDVAAFVNRDPLAMEAAIEDLRSFRPDLAVSLPNAAYAMLCITPEHRNIFRDILEIPTLLIWDHGVLQFSQLFLFRGPGSPDNAEESCVERMRRELDHPLLVHYAPDKGHIAVIHKLGILDACRVHAFVHFAFPAYTDSMDGAPPNGFVAPRLAFAGNVYLQACRNLPHGSHPILAGIESRMLQAKRADMTRSYWDLAVAEIEACDERARHDLALLPEASFFWRFVFDEVVWLGNTKTRLDVLTAVGSECEFFGNFEEPKMASILQEQYGIRFRGSLNCHKELPALYRGVELMIDVINAGYISGASPKVPSCLACGGLILFDYKSDFHEAFGDLADPIMYRSLDHLHSLIDGYLGNPRKRRDVARELQDRVLRDFTFTAFCKRVLADEPVWRQVA